MANPTSNFGWQMPTNTDLVKDLPADFEVFGQAVDTDLADLKGGTTGQVLSKTSGTDLDFTWVTPTDQTPLTTKGDLFGYSTADARIPIGTNGQVLTADSAESLGLKWADPAGGGKVLQVVQATYGTSTTVSTNTFADTGLSGSITPSSASSKVLILISQAMQVTRDNIAAGGGVRILRDSTFIFGDEAASAPSTIYLRAIASGTTTMDLNHWQNFVYLDSPATTSSVTYKTQIAVEAAVNNAAIVAQGGNNDASIILMEIGA